MAEPEITTLGRRPRGWGAMPYVLGAVTISKLATTGLQATFMVYLLKVYHMDIPQAILVINLWYGFSDFTPMAGAFFSDVKFGCFKTIAGASFATLLGITMITLTAWVPSLHPPPCSTDKQCQGATAYQLTFMAIALVFLSIGAGGTKPCNVPFGVNQFDRSTEAGQKSIRSFYNWYYMSIAVAELIVFTVIMYIQEKSWVWGYGILTILMAISIILLFAGTRIYVHVKPMGSIFLGIFQVFVTAYRKRQVAGEVFYDPPVVAEEESAALERLPQTDKFRWLNKAAVVLAGDLGQDGFPTNKWKLSSIQQVEEVKCLLKILPVWASGIFILTPMLQEFTFVVSQATVMDRHLGPHFQIPMQSFRVIMILTLGLWIPLYDRVIVPALKKATHREGGITQLQRVGAGSGLSILAMLVAGAIERWRRHSNQGGRHISAMWLAPQMILMGLSEACIMVGLIDFYNSEVPYRMRTLANSMIYAAIGVANFAGTVIAKMVHHDTAGFGETDWLAGNVNKGRLDLYYFLLAGLGVLNLGLFIYAAIRYQYKTMHAHA